MPRKKQAKCFSNPGGNRVVSFSRKKEDKRNQSILKRLPKDNSLKLVSKEFTITRNKINDEYANQSQIHKKSSELIKGRLGTRQGSLQQNQNSSEELETPLHTTFLDSCIYVDTKSFSGRSNKQRKHEDHQTRLSYSDASSNPLTGCKCDFDDGEHYFFGKEETINFRKRSKFRNNRTLKNNDSLRLKHNYHCITNKSKKNKKSKNRRQKRVKRLNSSLDNCTQLMNKNTSEIHNVLSKCLHTITETTAEDQMSDIFAEKIKLDILNVELLKNISVSLKSSSPRRVKLVRNFNVGPQNNLSKNIESGITVRKDLLEMSNRENCITTGSKKSCSETDEMEVTDASGIISEHIEDLEEDATRSEKNNKLETKLNVQVDELFKSQIEDNHKKNSIKMEIHSDSDNEKQSDEETEKFHPNRRLQLEKPKTPNIHKCEYRNRKIRFNSILLCNEPDNSQSLNQSQGEKLIILNQKNNISISDPLITNHPQTETFTGKKSSHMWIEVLKNFKESEKNDWLVEKEDSDVNYLASLHDYEEMGLGFARKYDENGDTFWERRMKEKLASGCTKCFNEFYIPPAHVEVLHQRFTDDFTPKEGLQLVCELRKWPLPVYSQVSQNTSTKGFIACCELKTMKFTPGTPASNCLLAEDLAASLCLEWLGLRPRRISGCEDICLDSYF